MSKFLTELDVKEIDEGTWELQAPLVYQSDFLNRTIMVPAGFKTDFASVPRVPLVYLAYGDRAHREAVVHDFLYDYGKYPRSWCDHVFYEAMGSRGKPLFVRAGMWAGVRLGGWVAWNEHRRQGHPN